MDPVSNTDRLVLLLRQKLQERARAGASGSAAKKSSAQAPQVPVTGLHALASVDAKDDRPLRRAFIQNLLADQLGPSFLNDAQFQQVVTRVTEAIDDDAVAAKLLSSLIADLRNS